MLLPTFSLEHRRGLGRNRFPQHHKLNFSTHLRLPDKTTRKTARLQVKRQIVDALINRSINTHRYRVGRPGCIARQRN